MPQKGCSENHKPEPLRFLFGEFMVDAYGLYMVGYESDLLSDVNGES
jgi:hypothetical protein